MGDLLDINGFICLIETELDTHIVYEGTLRLPPVDVYSLLEAHDRGAVVEAGHTNICDMLLQDQMSKIDDEITIYDTAIIVNEHDGVSFNGSATKVALLVCYIQYLAYKLDQANELNKLVSL